MAGERERGERVTVGVFGGGAQVAREPLQDLGGYLPDLHDVDHQAAEGLDRERRHRIGSWLMSQEEGGGRRTGSGGYALGGRIALRTRRWVVGAGHAEQAVVEVDVGRGHERPPNGINVIKDHVEDISRQIDSDQYCISTVRTTV